MAKESKYHSGDYVFAKIYKDQNIKVPFVVSYQSPNDGKYYIHGDGSHYVSEKDLSPATENDFDAYYGNDANNFKVFKKGGRLKNNFEVDIHFKGLSGSDRNIGKFIVSGNDLDRLEMEYPDDISIDVLDESDKDNVPISKIKNEIQEQYQSKFKKGGRLKSALMRDRKYVSQENWEQDYLKHRATRPRYYKMMEKGGKVKKKNSITNYDGREITAYYTKEKKLSEDNFKKLIKEDGFSAIEDAGGKYHIKHHDRTVAFYYPERNMLWLFDSSNHSPVVEWIDKNDLFEKDEILFKEGVTFEKGGSMNSELKEFEIYKNGTQQGTVYAKNKKEAEEKVYATYGEDRTVHEVDSDEYKNGGRLKSALMRDRKYVSEEEWEQRYKKYRSTRPRYYKEDGGSIDAGHMYRVTEVEGESDTMNQEELIDFANGLSFYEMVDTESQEITDVDQAKAFLENNSYHVETIMKAGGDIEGKSARAFFESIDASKLTPKAKEFLTKELLSDPDLDSISVDDEYFQDVKNVFESKFPEAIGGAPVEKKPKKSSNPEVDKLEKEIADLKELIDMEDDKKAIAKLEQEIADLKELIELQS